MGTTIKDFNGNAVFTCDAESIEAAVGKAVVDDVSLFSAKLSPELWREAYLVQRVNMNTLQREVDASKAAPEPFQVVTEYQPAERGELPRILDLGGPVTIQFCGRAGVMNIPAAGLKGEVVTFNIPGEAEGCTVDKGWYVVHPYADVVRVIAQAREYVARRDAEARRTPPECVVAPEVTDNDHKRVVMEKLAGIDGCIGWAFRWVSELEHASTGSAETHAAAVRLALHGVMRSLEAGVCGLARELSGTKKAESADKPAG